VSFKYGTTLTANVRFQASLAYNTRVYFPNDADLLNDALEWDQYATGDIPAAGSNLSVSDALYVREGPQYMGQFVAPVACRFIGIAYSVDLYNPDSGATNFRLGVFKAVFDDGDAQADDAVWTSLGYIDSTTMSGDPAGQVQKGSASFNSSDGDISAGEVVGVLAESFGGTTSQNIGNIEGVVTMLFRVL